MAASLVMTSEWKGAWDPQFFMRTHPKADPAVPALAWLESVPDAVEAEIMATIDAVAQGPPPQFRGGLRYQAMHGDMTGWFEVRTKHRKRLYRLFCLQDRKAPGRQAERVGVLEVFLQEGPRAR
jgi:hypothetical protein